jgi:hypothetical protein
MLLTGYAGGCQTSSTAAWPMLDDCWSRPENRSPPGTTPTSLLIETMAPDSSGSAPQTVNRGRKDTRPRDPFVFGSLARTYLSPPLAVNSCRTCRTPVYDCYAICSCLACSLTTTVMEFMAFPFLGTYPMQSRSSRNREWAVVFWSGIYHRIRRTMRRSPTVCLSHHNIRDCNTFDSTSDACGSSRPRPS